MLAKEASEQSPCCSRKCVHKLYTQCGEALVDAVLDRALTVYSSNQNRSSDRLAQVLRGGYESASDKFDYMFDHGGYLRSFDHRGPIYTCGRAWEALHQVSKHRRLVIQRSVVDNEPTYIRQRKQYENRQTGPREHVRMFLEHFFSYDLGHVEIMPFHDGNSETFKKHLPSWMTKIGVYYCYKSWAEDDNAILRDLATESEVKLASVDTFRRTWKEDFPDVTTPKVKRFSHCPICAAGKALRDQAREICTKDMTPEERQVHRQHQQLVRRQVRAEQKVHLERVPQERRDLNSAVFQSRLGHGNFFFIEIDSMDSAKTLLPHWVRIPKTVKPDMLLKYHLTCVKYDGYRPDDIYYYTNTTPHDSSTTCTLIWITIMKTKGGKKPVDTSWEKCLTHPWKLVEAVPLSYAKAIHDASGSREVFNEDGTMVRKKWPPSDDTERPSLRLGAGLAHSFRGAESVGEAAGAMAAATVSMHPAARPAFRSDRIRTEQRVQSTIQTSLVKRPDHPPRLALAAPDRIPRARALVHTKKGLRALNICLIFGADAIERDVAEVAGVPAASLRVFPSEQAALEGSYAAQLNTFGDRLRKQGQRPPRENLQAAQYTFDGDTLVFHVAAPPVLGGGARRPRQRSTQQPSSAYSTGGSASRSRASPAQVQQLCDDINTVWPQDDRGVYYPSRDSEHAGPGAHPLYSPPRPPFDELELVAANVAHAEAAKDKAAAKKRHYIEDDEDNDDQDSDEDLGLASLVGAQAAATKASWPAGKGKGARGKKRGRGGQ
eukprot:jgi/Tetstr1/427860/TSEL_017938.t1